MNLKDRGNKKWPAMMVIEHRKKLSERLKREEIPLISQILSPADW